jgi:glycosyltransferase involved in cell wall biosynthesis
VRIQDGEGAMSPMSIGSVFDEFERAYESGEYFERLINTPSPHRLRKPPELIFDVRLSSLDPRFTIVTPTYNHAPYIEASLAAAATTATMPFDVIVVDDASDDDTVGRVQFFFAHRPLPLVARATIVRNPVPIYETASDNIGFTLARTEVIIEIQADIAIREPGYDRLLLQALSRRSNPSALSGRCGHTFKLLTAGRTARLRSLFRNSPAEHVGLCDSSIERPDVVNALRGRVYRCETVNRGPWVLRKSDLERHGYLDERHFFLGNDDHDYHRRLFESEGRRPAYVPMSLHSPLAAGAARRRRVGINKVVFELLSVEKRGSAEFRSFLDGCRESFLPAVDPDDDDGEGCN